ncbi:protein adenylyltransferase SelO [Mongoliimonas terrestris]|uniref:protein adenylyltransferase SelO n=1 Tax=Mongoliimonas terrestris TaxID=1709001 RepID=UPI000949A964|nr:YdiU family protein [Mongoliimonas terrestris]
MTAPLPFDNSYARLPERFYARIAPNRVSAPRLIKVNRALALDLGLDPDWLESPEGVDFLAGHAMPDGAEPIAQAYAGHQFGQFVPQLGDGRAMLVGEVIDRHGVRRDIQLKGSGPTPFSRRGDGRAALGPVLREYIVSEAMAALGIPTTRTLAAATTGETVVREAFLPGAVLARVASSHVRVGTFQYFAARKDAEAIRTLADHVIDRHYPEARDAALPARALLEGVVDRQADLIAAWLLVGFIHGVMNTDNMSIAGETIDYGPCAFLDVFDPSKVFSSIDQFGRYAYGAQPSIGLWNLTRFAETLLPLLDDDQDKAVAIAQESLTRFGPRFEAAFHAGLRRKAGLTTAEEGDVELVRALLDAMTENQADYTLVFRYLADAALGAAHDEPVRRLFVDPTVFDRWAVRWRERTGREAVTAEDRRILMRAANPAFIPRNHRIEAVIRAAMDRNDFKPFETLLQVLSRPFDDQPEHAAYADPPALTEQVLATFCGT